MVDLALSGASRALSRDCGWCLEKLRKEVGKDAGQLDETGRERSGLLRVALVSLCTEVGYMFEPGVIGAVSNREDGSESIANILMALGSTVLYEPPQACN